MKRSLWPTGDPVKDYFPLPKEIFSYKRRKSCAIKGAEKIF